MTVQTWIDSTRDMLLTDYVEEYATLQASLAASAAVQSVSFTLPAAVVPGVVTGSTFEIGTELFLCVRRFPRRRSNSATRISRL